MRVRDIGYNPAMRIPRVHVPFLDPSLERVRLSPEESHHLVRVLRRSTGDRVDLLAGGGGLFPAEIDTIQREAGALVATVRVLGPGSPTGGGLLPWTVGAALVKGDAFEQALQMACELGIRRFWPLLTTRTVVQLRDGPRKLQRWRRRAVEAAKQCGRAEPIEVLPPGTFEEVLRSWRETCRSDPEGALPRGWILCPGAPPSDDGPAGVLSPALFLVGPEGGFTPQEARQAEEAGLRPLGLPTPVLRTPTAVALVGALGVLLGGPVGRSSEDSSEDRGRGETAGDCH